MVSSGLCHFARSLFCQTQAFVHGSKSSLSCYRIIQRQICFLGKHQGIKIIFSPLWFRHVKRSRIFKNLQLNAGYYLWEQKLCSLQAGVTSLGGDLQSRHYHQTLSLQEPFGSRGPGGIHPDQHRSTQETISQLNDMSVFSAWGLRLAVENGYLSWCRNTYLCTVVAIALMGEGTTILAQHAAEAAFVVAGINLSWGTYQFIYNISHLRRNLSMSVFAAVTNVFLAMVHIMLWFMVCTLFVGYTDDNESDVASFKDAVSLEKDSPFLERSN